jgi:magnesium transporter
VTEGQVSPEPLLGVAAEYATERVPVARPDDEAGAVRAALQARSFDSVHDVVVLEGESFVGVVPARRLLAAEPGTPLARLMEPDPSVVRPDTDQERAAAEMVERGESSIVVVDGEGRFVGLIPPHTMLAVLVAEHEEDLARLGGYMVQTRRARRAAEERVTSRLWHRLPWLFVGLLGAMGSAGIVGAFEDQLDEKVRELRRSWP